MLSSWIRSLTRTRRIAVPIHIPARKSGAAARPVQSLLSTIGEVEELLVPLTLRPDLCICPAVKPGDRVGLGDPLSQPDSPGAVAAFSPAPAVVDSLTTIDTQHAAGLPAVRLQLFVDGNNRAAAGDYLANSPGPLQTDPPTQPEDIRQVLADLARVEDLPATLDELGVVAAYANRPEPLGGLLRRASTARVNLLVVNAIQSEPRLASDHRLLVEAALAVAAGARAIADYLSLRRTTLLVSATRHLPAIVTRQLRRYRIRTVPIRTSFPGDAESIVLKRLFNRNIPAGGCGLDARCLMLPADAAWRVGIALRHQMPIVAQPINIAGDCLAPKHQGVYLVPVGLTITGLAHWLTRRGMLREQPRMVILGGAMTGSAVADPSRTVIDPTTHAVLLTHHWGHLETTACIRCGRCVYGCPMGLDPVAILDALEARRFESLARLAPQHCIDCNVCSYVCPSHLPLAQAARTAKAIL